ncbi:hypothetical protein [Flavobacterium sp. NKUCC04_CG]|uniref:hypothetical protein n=1 Tax=Flavobacterium sp. NKUCC04_CG TaxID=2842121 RepID=UPI001C5BBA76|nr:hypothetical protein [Flavobacterium sp. NKUCC04_CG]MBW3517843.1 hypothetical protein [Flavobacterium sp. NKUCC04_CG]
MKKLFLLFIITISFLGCSKDSSSNRNPYLPDYPISLNINLNLPQYSNLRHPSTAVRVFGEALGARGLIIFNSGSGYMAYDVACPNHELKDCSTMELIGVSAECPCDGLKYLLFTGLSEGAAYPLKQYRIDIMGDVLRVYN